MQRPLVLTAALLLAPGLAAAQRAGVTAIPDSALAAIDRAFAWATAQSPGCAVGVAQAGRPVLTRAWGMANLEHDVANTPATIFESGSVAKQFTAAALVLLAQDGKLSLDDDVRRWLPEVPDFGDTITIRHLLTHTSGLRDQWGLLSLAGNGPGRQVHTLDRILDLVSRQRALNFRPGEEYLYSNTGYTLAAIIAQRASGKRFAQFSEERIFRPLGMTDTRWRDDFARIVRGRATAYTGTAQIGFRQDMPFTNVHGNGGLLTTVADLLAWNAFLDDPRPDVGGRALVEALETVGRLRGGRPIGYALGLGVGTEGGRRVVDHSGATAGYRTWLARWPEQKLAVAVLCNSGSANAVSLGRSVARQFLPAAPAPAQAGAPAPSHAPAAQELARQAGHWHSLAAGASLRTDVRDGSLIVTAPQAATPIPLAPGRYHLPSRGILHFVGEGATAREVVLAQPSGDTVRLARVQPADSSRASLQAFVGRYHSAELDSWLTVELRDGALVAWVAPGETLRLQPSYRDAFYAPGAGTLVFRRGRSGRVDGLGVWAGRVRDVRFDKR